MRIIIIGDGGHSRVIQDMMFLNEAYEIAAILDDKYEDGFQTNGIIHAPLSFLMRLMQKDTKVVVAIGDNLVRKKVVEQLHLPSNMYATVIHPAAVVSRTAQVGNGTVIMPNSVINANATIGMHCIINTAAIVEHDNEIGNYTHISPNATLTGNVTTGEGVHVGAAATVIPNMHLGSWSVIGAGSTAIESIPAFSKAVGSPARIMERILIK